MNSTPWQRDNKNDDNDDQMYQYLYTDNRLKNAYSWPVYMTGICLVVRTVTHQNQYSTIASAHNKFGKMKSV